MTLKFNPRNYRHLPTGGVTELHIRMSVGRGAVQRSKTKILVDPTLVTVHIRVEIKNRVHLVIEMNKDFVIMKIFG